MKRKKEWSWTREDPRGGGPLGKPFGRPPVSKGTTNTKVNVDGAEGTGSSDVFG